MSTHKVSSNQTNNNSKKTTVFKRFKPYLLLPSLKSTPKPNAGTNIAPKPNNSKPGKKLVKELDLKKEVSVLRIPEAVSAVLA